jgi:steroid delta-isomerase-like uncharacterized protein
MMAAPADTTTVMPRAELEGLIARYLEAWGRRDPDAIAEHHSPDGVFHLHAAAGPVSGRDAIRATFTALFAQWPDLDFEQRRMVLHDRGWTVEWKMSGTLAEPLELDGAVVGKPGARMDVDAIDLIEVEDGLISAKHTYLDSVTLLRQLGEAA